MPELPGAPYAWRRDPAVPAFDDAAPLFVFDGVCVLCSGGAAFVMRHDQAGKVAMASAQSPLGQALYRHFGLEMDESYLFLAGGRAFTKSAGYLAVFDALGGWWRWLKASAILPEGVRDRLYDILARNRYRWFGKADYCALLTPEQRGRLIDR